MTAMTVKPTSSLVFGGFSVKRLPDLADTWKLTLLTTLLVLEILEDFLSLSLSSLLLNLLQVSDF